MTTTYAGADRRKAERRELFDRVLGFEIVEDPSPRLALPRASTVTP